MIILSLLVEEGSELSIEELSKRSGKSLSTVASTVELLKEKKLVEVLEIEITYAKTTEEGKTYINGLPEEILVNLIKEHGEEIEISFVERLMGKEKSSIAVGWARKRGWIEIIKERNVLRFIKYEPLNKHREFLRQFLNESVVREDVENNSIFVELVKRKLIELNRRKIKIVKLAISIDKAKEFLSSSEIISRLTHEVIVKDLWKTHIIKPYNISAMPPVKYLGKKHFFKEFVNIVKEVMESLGFEEIKDDYVIPELWNFDILFQAQDHPSRDIHDILIVDGYADTSYFNDIVERVKNVHEKGGTSGSSGWGYSWSYQKAAKLILRSHTTAVTAKALATCRQQSVRFYAIDRVFRRDNPDARHSPEFTNFDGVIMEKDFNFRKLLGLLTQILKSIGIEKIKFKPAYFPFTEPSVEGYGYVPGYGWIEIFGAGLFRPEVLEMLGVGNPVGAWGMGVERLAMVVYGIDDIRLLFSKDIEFVRRFSAIKMIKW